LRGKQGVLGELKWEKSGSYNDGQAMKQFDHKKDGPVNNYAGSRSLSENECQKAMPEEYWNIPPDGAAWMNFIWKRSGKQKNK